MTIFSLSTVLSYLSIGVIVGQTPIATSQGCCFSLSSFYPINQSVTTRGLTRWFSAIGVVAMMLPATSTPCWAKAMSGESTGTIHWIDSMIVWSLTILKFGFRFQIILLLGVRALDASDPPIVGYLLELF
jgi:hypothetical protein